MHTTYYLDANMANRPSQRFQGTYGYPDGEQRDRMAYLPPATTDLDVAAAKSHDPQTADRSEKAEQCHGSRRRECRRQ